MNESDLVFTRVRNLKYGKDLTKFQVHPFGVLKSLLKYPLYSVNLVDYQYLLSLNFVQNHKNQDKYLDPILMRVKESSIKNRRLVEQFSCRVCPSLSCVKFDEEWNLREQNCKHRRELTSLLHFQHNILRKDRGPQEKIFVSS